MHRLLSGPLLLSLGVALTCFAAGRQSTLPSFSFDELKILSTEAAGR